MALRGFTYLLLQRTVQYIGSNVSIETMALRDFLNPKHPYIRSIILKWQDDDIVADDRIAN